MKCCYTCQRLKEDDDFYSYETGLYKSCKSCISKTIVSKKRKIYSWVDNYKSSLGCGSCGNKDKRCLQLHHRDSETKKRSVAQLIGSGYIFKTVKAEIEKCEVLCANCHSIHHYDERRSTTWGGKSSVEEQIEDETEPVVEQLELFLNFVEG